MLAAVLAIVKIRPNEATQPRLRAKVSSRRSEAAGFVPGSEPILAKALLPLDGQAATRAERLRRFGRLAFVGLPAPEQFPTVEKMVRGLVLCRRITPLGHQSLTIDQLQRGSPAFFLRLQSKFRREIPRFAGRLNLPTRIAIVVLIIFRQAD